MDKPFKTFDEQVSILNGSYDLNKRKRMNTDNNTKLHLMRDNYYSIINFYKEPFIAGRDTNGEDIYLPNVHFNELKALHDFDSELRILFFNSFTKIEKFFKTAIAYYFSEYKIIKTFLNACSLFRNVSAHNERFYNFMTGINEAVSK